MATPDWLEQSGPLLESGREPGGRVRDRHLAVLRELLAAEHLRQADLPRAERDVARMALEALSASSAMVAFYDPSTQRWTARTAQGEELDQQAISQVGSTAVLDRVRLLGEPILTAGAQPFEIHSTSVAAQSIESVLAVPLHWWTPAGETRRATFAGCLYVHRTAAQAPFLEPDVDLILDIARLAEPTLNVLRQLAALEDEARAQREELEGLRSAAAREYRLGALRSNNERFGRDVLETLRRVARADRVGLLVLGPSGAGKSFLAKAYHFECPRARGPFVTLDCAQITSETTLGAELFGYAPSSGYANAPPRGRPGKAKQADGGTLFLDEIGTVPLELQQRLLRLIQEGRFSPLGGSDEEHVDVQIIAATNEALEELVARGRFREDLYWRVAEIVVTLPPLDERLEDIPDLARTFLTTACGRFGRPFEGLSATAMNAVMRHPWSRAGNLRGLEHVINRAVLLAAPKATQIDVGDLQFEALGRTLAATGAGPTTQDRPIPSTPLSASAPAPPTRLDLPSASAPTSSPSPGTWRATPRNRRRLRPLLEAKIAAYAGDVHRLARDDELCHHTGQPHGRIPLSTLYAWLRDLDLREALASAQEARHEDDFAVIAAAIREHGSGSAAARALGMRRSALIWQLRKAGKNLSEVLAEEG